MCTGKAVLATLVGLGTLSMETGTQILSIMQNKANLTHQYQGKKRYKWWNFITILRAQKVIDFILYYKHKKTVQYSTKRKIS